MSNLSELLPAGAGAKSADFVASGTLGSGVTVALKSDGTVEAVNLSAEELGSEYVFENATSYDISAGPIGSSKFVIAYRDSANSGYGTAIVATISGTSISYGTPVVFSSVLTSQTTVAYDASNDKVLVSYRGTSSYGWSIVGTVSGTSISFGSQSSFSAARTATALASVYDPNNQKIIITYIDQGNGNYGTIVGATISGTSVSFTGLNNFNNGSTGSTDIAYNVDDSNFIVGYRDTAAGGYAYARVGTFNGTSFSFGSETVVSYDTANLIKVAYTTDSKVVLVYQNGSSSNNATAAVGTVSGTSISFGTTLTVSTTTNAYNLDVTYDTTNAKVVFVYANAASSGLVRPATVSGTTLTLDTATTFNTGAVNSSLCINYGADTGSSLIAYTDGGNSSYGTAAVFKNVSSNSTDFIGITDQAIADTATGAVIVQGGVSEKVTGLTTGSDYYVQDDGSLASGSIPYDISSASFVQSFSVSAQETAPHGVAFNTDGTKMFIVGSTGDDVNEYALSTVFDVSTASFTQNFSVASQENGPYAIAFNTDGTKMFILGVAGDDVNEYTLSTGFDISTASFVDSFSVSAQDTLPLALAFSTDGTKMFVVGATGVDVNEYTLSTGFDVSTASFVVSFSVSSQDTGPAGIAFNNDGTQMFISGQTADSIHKYTLTTGFSVSTASFLNSFSVASQDSSPRGLAFSANGTKMFVVGGAGVDVNEYATTAASTTVPAGRALSSTSILLEG